MADDPLDEMKDWEAVAREQGGVAAYFERPDLPRQEGTGTPMLEPLILKIEREGDDLVSVHLYDIAGNNRMMFLTQDSDLDEARKNSE